MTLAFNPTHVKLQDLEGFTDWMMREFGCAVYLIPHYDSNAEPLYCVQFTDTKEKLQYHVTMPQKS